MKHFVFSFVVVVHLLLVDQIAKAAALFYLKGNPPVPYGPFFNLAYVENRGCAWGMFQGQVWPLAAFGVLAFAFLVWKRKSVFPKGFQGLVAEHLLYAGIVGNVLDRFYHGFVVDFFDCHWGCHHFPCFNVADSYITVAAAILIACSLFEKRTS